MRVIKKIDTRFGPDADAYAKKRSRQLNYPESLHVVRIEVTGDIVETYDVVVRCEHPDEIDDVADAALDAVHARYSGDWTFDLIGVRFVDGWDHDMLIN